MSENEIKSWLEETYLSGSSKKILTDEALKIYDTISPLNLSETEAEKVSLRLACDKHSCAIPRKIPKAKIKHLSKGRNLTEIYNCEAIDRLNPMANLLGIDDDTREKAGQILSKYKENFSTEYYRGSPLVTTAAAIHIPGLMIYGDCQQITQKEISEKTGISPPAISKRYKKIVKDLDIELW